jgi:transcriptional regulator with XRE-family HTH domain
VEALRRLRREKGISMKELGKKIGVAESTISQYETGKREPDFETLLKLGEFFNVSVDYLLRGEQYHEKTPALTAKDERDISKKLEEALSQLESSQEGLMFQGEPLDDATKELIAISLRNSLEMGKRLAKQKFTPKKYKGEQ